MKRLESGYRKLLKSFATAIQANLEHKIDDPRIEKINKIKIEPTDTFGWYIDIFKLKKISGRGKVQIWIDKFPDISRPTLSICFWSKDLARVEKVANCMSDNFADKHPHKTEDIDKGLKLKTPLAKKYYNRYLIEPYPFWKFITYYFSDNIALNNKTSNALINKISDETGQLMRRTVSALEIINNDEDYSKKERQIVARHKRFERDKKLAEIVKRRDGCQCRVCDFVFIEKYGEDLGRGFAEAHHIIALSQIKRKNKSTPADLITVCSNCHRMLHRMEGKPDDYKNLRKLVMKKKPNSQH